jgi:hypothetical protein
VAPAALDNVVGGQNCLFFLGHHAAGNEYGPALLRADLLPKPFAEMAHGWRIGIVFQVSGHFHAAFERAHGAKT